MRLTYKNAVQRRQNAIGMLSYLYLPTDPDGSVPYDMRVTDTTEIAGNIRKLAQLGRTERWTGRIEQWARMVEENPEPMKSLRWAFLQGMVYASHASN